MVDWWGETQTNMTKRYKEKKYLFIFIFRVSNWVFIMDSYDEAQDVPD